jgi:hypothetical protein
VGLEAVFGVVDGAALAVGVGETVTVESGRRAGAGLGVVFGVGDGASLAAGVGEAVGVDSGRREGAGLGDEVDGIVLSLAGGETTGVGSGRRAGAWLDAGSGSDGRRAGEADGVALARISLRRFKICSRL